MDVIDKQLAIANEQTLIELSNKGIYKRALKESENMTLSAEKIHECYIVKLDGETCTINHHLMKVNAVVFQEECAGTLSQPYCF